MKGVVFLGIFHEFFLKLFKKISWQQNDQTLQESISKSYNKIFTVYNNLNLRHVHLTRCFSSNIVTSSNLFSKFLKYLFLFIDIICILQGRFYIIGSFFLLKIVLLLDTYYLQATLVIFSKYQDRSCMVSTSSCTQIEI